jgi:hypothetical protein
MIAGGAAAVALAAGAIALDRARGPNEVLPDLRQAKPTAISTTQVDGQHRLVFLSAVENVGAAALVIHGRRASLADAAMAVEQIVRLADGSTRTYRVDSELRYVVSETHEHWHLLGFEHYELRRATDGRLVAPDRKTGFCLGDRFDAPAELPNEPAKAVWTRECGRGGRALLFIREGISPGYGDDYVPRLEGQYVVLDGVPAGRYRLVHRVNPERALHESDFSNNTASVLLELSWREGKPKVAVVG